MCFGACIHLIEATTAAPEEMPQSKPSSLARRRAISTLSLLLTLKISSRMVGSSTLGTKPAPIPCICSGTIYFRCKSSLPAPITYWK